MPLEMVHIGVFAVILFLFISIASGVTNYTQTNIQTSLVKLNCPTPDFNTGWDRTNCNNPPPSRGGYANDLFILWKNVNLFGFGNWTAGIPVGWFDYTADWVSSGVEHTSGWFGLFSVALSGASPSGFSILGFHTTDLNPLGVVFVLMLYGFCYLGIGLLIYKGLSPFVRA